MTLNEYIGRLQGQIHSDESRLTQEKKRLEFVQRIRTNIEATRNSIGSSLNRSWDDLSKSDDPVKERLYRIPGYIARPLTDKMLDRSMTEWEYGLALNGKMSAIVEYVEKLLFMRILDAVGKRDELHFALGDYKHFEANAYKYARRSDSQTTLENLASRTRSLMGIK